MTRGERIWAGAAAAYLAIGVITFGHSAAHYREPVREPCPKDQLCLERETLPLELRATFAAMIWPFYWSWVAQS